MHEITTFSKPFYCKETWGKFKWGNLKRLKQVLRKQFIEIHCQLLP